MTFKVLTNEDIGFYCIHTGERSPDVKDNRFGQLILDCGCQWAPGDDPEHNQWQEWEVLDNLCGNRP